MLPSFLHYGSSAMKLKSERTQKSLRKKGGSYVATEITIQELWWGGWDSNPRLSD